MSTMQLELFDTSPTRWQSWLASTLGAANSKPPWRYRERFYRMKDVICRRHGIRDGEDTQEIVRHCWSCHGTGGLYERGGCYKCGGDGIYSATYVRLERWKVGGRVFHRPVDRVQNWGGSPFGKPTISGIVQHAKVSDEDVRLATMKLAAVFDRGLLVLMLLDRPWIWKVRRHTDWLLYRFRRCGWRCYACNRRLWPWRNWTGGYCSQKCHDDSLPF